MHAADHVPSGRLREAVFGLSLVGNVILLASVLGVLAFIQMGLFAHGRASRQPTTAFTLRSPSATMTASPSPSPDGAALQVTPSGVGRILLQIVALGLLLLASAPWRVGVFAFLFGVGFGGSYPARATVVADRFGPHAYGKINGIIAFPTTLTAALGVLAMSAVTARFSTLDGAMLLVLLGSAIAAAAIVSLEVISPVTHQPVSGETERQWAQ
jgi:hypothetical protein